MDKVKVAIMFGGRSTEHEISIISAKNIVNAIDKEKYQPVLIIIDKEGVWWYFDGDMDDIDTSNPKDIRLPGGRDSIYFSQNADRPAIVNRNNGKEITEIDVVFPVLHGLFGEDGAIQGLAKLANLPCVGPGVLGSAVGMDKEVMKRLLRDASIDSARFITLRRGDEDTLQYEQVAAQLGTELFVKPVNLGSSVGVSHVKTADDYPLAVEKAFRYDNKVIVEERINGREIECAVLGNDNPQASIPGEILPTDGFYSFEAKYVDDSGAALEIPAQLSDDQIAQVQQLAIMTYQCLECSGMARVDMFLADDGRLLINEINTIPGFTSVSMYPSLWHHSGLAYEDLIDQLIQLAIEEQDQQNKLIRQLKN